MKRILIIILTFATIGLYAQSFTTESQWNNYFKKNIQKLDPIEGVWSNTNTVKLYDNYNRLRNSKYNPQAEKVAIYKSGNIYKVYSIDADNTYMKRSFKNTATSGVYLFECYYPQSYSTAKSNAILTGNGLLEFSYEKPIAQLKKDFGSNYVQGMQIIFEHKWIKISPSAEDYKNKQSSNPSSGTGFAISSNGIIVTNYHVIEGARTIKVRGINSDFNKAYNAKVLVSDKNNDLALIQIDDYSFTSIGTIPYTIKTKLANVGESVFALGYPLRAAMGDEIKLTNGIISSKTGFQGDVTSYQVSVPVQPGNSGGPLFDSDGNVIGIINAKLTIAENASYAVKANYLTNLIELLNTPPKLPAYNSLKGKSLTAQVQLIKKFVYIIETE